MIVKRGKRGVNIFTDGEPVLIDLEIERIERIGMAVGWARDDAVQDQIGATVESAIQLARRRLPDGVSLTHCEECEEVIPDARRKALPGVRCCVRCQSEREKTQKTVELYNRRGSKDSQLK